MLFEKETSILFTGDSITDAGREHPVGESDIPGLKNGLGTGYVSVIDTLLNVVYPDYTLQLRNTGVSGNTSRDLLARWQTDVLDLAPDYLVVDIGGNDVWRHFDAPAMRAAHVSVEEYADNLRAMADSTAPIVRSTIFMTPYFLEPNTADPMRAKMDAYRAACHGVCQERGLLCVDLQQAFDEYLQWRYSAYLMWDRIHPGRIGSMIIARSFLKAVGFDRPFL